MLREDTELYRDCKTITVYHYNITRHGEHDDATQRPVTNSPRRDWPSRRTWPHRINDNMPSWWRVDNTSNSVEIREWKLLLTTLTFYCSRYLMVWHSETVETEELSVKRCVDYYDGQERQSLMCIEFGNAVERWRGGAMTRCDGAAALLHLYSIAPSHRAITPSQRFIAPLYRFIAPSYRSIASLHWWIASRHRVVNIKHTTTMTLLGHRNNNRSTDSISDGLAQRMVTIFAIAAVSVG